MTTIVHGLCGDGDTRGPWKERRGKGKKGLDLGTPETRTTSSTHSLRREIKTRCDYLYVKAQGSGLNTRKSVSLFLQYFINLRHVGHHDIKPEYPIRCVFFG